MRVFFFVLLCSRVHFLAIIPYQRHTNKNAAAIMSDHPQTSFNVDNGYHIFTVAELEIMDRMKERMKGDIYARDRLRSLKSRITAK